MSFESLLQSYPPTISYEDKGVYRWTVDGIHVYASKTKTKSGVRYQISSLPHSRRVVKKPILLSTEEEKTEFLLVLSDFLETIYKGT